jgi:hypothetical protein
MLHLPTRLLAAAAALSLLAGPAHADGSCRNPDNKNACDREH